MEVSELLKEYKRNKAKLKNSILELEQLKEDLEVHQDLLNKEEQNFTKDELIDELALSSIQYDNQSAPTNAFNSKTENVALSIDQEIENVKNQRKMLVEGYYKIKGNIDIKERQNNTLRRNVERIENALEGLNVKQKFIVEKKHIDELQWDEVEEIYNVTFPKNPISIDRMKTIREEAFNLIKDVI